MVTCRELFQGKDLDVGLGKHKSWLLLIITRTISHVTTTNMSRFDMLVPDTEKCYKMVFGDSYESPGYRFKLQKTLMALLFDVILVSN